MQNTSYAVQKTTLFVTAWENINVSMTGRICLRRTQNQIVSKYHWWRACRMLNTMIR